VCDLSEEALLRRITRILPPAPGGMVGVGDDAAILPAGRGELVLSTDTLVENVHFRRAWILPRELGEKALAVNLSDLAAMGARPEAALVALTLPPDLPVRVVEQFYRGMAALARRVGVPIAGGNLTRGDAFSVTLTVVGRAGRGASWRRGTARTGDQVLVLGRPGSATLGMEILRRGEPGGAGVTTGRRQTRGDVRRRESGGPADPWDAARSPAWRKPLLRGIAGRAVRAWLCPTAHLEAAEVLRPFRPRAVIDISDGLSRDLPRLAGADHDIVVSPPVDVRHLAPADSLGLSVQDLFWHGGEDYGLAFTLSARMANRLVAAGAVAGVPVVCLGRVVPGRGRLLLDDGNTPKPLPRDAFDHFSR